MSDPGVRSVNYMKMNPVISNEKMTYIIQRSQAWAFPRHVEARHHVQPLWAG